MPKEGTSQITLIVLAGMAQNLLQVPDVQHGTQHENLQRIQQAAILRSVSHSFVFHHFFFFQIVETQSTDQGRNGHQFTKWEETRELACDVIQPGSEIWGGVGCLFSSILGQKYPLPCGSISNRILTFVTHPASSFGVLP